MTVGQCIRTTLDSEESGMIRQYPDDSLVAGGQDPSDGPPSVRVSYFPFADRAAPLFKSDLIGPVDTAECL